MVLVPIQLTDYVREPLARETAMLSPSDVHVIAVDDASLAALGPNAMDPGSRGAALDAGLAQPEREIDALAAKWSAPTR